MAVVAMAAASGRASGENPSITEVAHDCDLYSSRARRIISVPMRVDTLRMAKKSSKVVLSMTNTKCRGERWGRMVG